MVQPPDHMIIIAFSTFKIQTAATARSFGLGIQQRTLYMGLTWLAQLRINFVVVVFVSKCISGSIFFILQHNYHKYVFPDTQTSQTAIRSNESACYEFPSSTSQCDFSTTSLFLSLSSECNIKLTPERAGVQDFACYKKFQEFEVEVNYEDSLVCLHNWNLTSNRTTIHFLCMSNCPEENCNRVYNFISSHQIILGKHDFMNFKVQSKQMKFAMKDTSKNIGFLSVAKKYLSA